MFPHSSLLASLVAAQPQGSPSGGGGFPMDLLLPVVMMAVLYVIWIRPASKERKQHQAMLEALKRGDEVVTSSGMIGHVADLTDRTVTLEVAKNVKIRMLRSAIARKVEAGKGAAEEKPAD
jgi:preprotein translocase subunit YajC